MIFDGATVTLSEKDVFSTEDKIASFAKLANGWSYSEGESFSTAVIDHTITLAQRALAEGFLETDAFPGLEGELMLAVYSQGKTLELVVNADESISSCLEISETQKVRDSHLSLKQAFQKIAELKAECTSSEHWTRIITTEHANDLSVPPFAIGKGFLFSTNPAHYVPAATSVRILPAFTAQSPVRHQYFAGYTEEYTPALAS
jgi:hypothetical protein